MSGTKAGGLRAAKTNKQRHGKDFYARIGREGGKLSKGGPFVNNRELASIAGRKGGQRSSNKEFWKRHRAAKKEARNG